MKARDNTCSLLHHQQTYQAVPLKSLVAGLPEEGSLQFTALDGFVATIPNHLFQTKGDAVQKAEAWLAIENPAHPWEALKPGQPSANPAGRPKGSRNKLSELFISEMCADFMENGTDVIKRVRTEDPSAYAKIIASILPKQVEVSEVGAFGDMSEQQLDEFIALASRKLRDQSVAGHA